MNKRFGLLLLTVLAFAAMAFAQTGNVEGIVRYSPDGDVVSGAAVSIRPHMGGGDPIFTTTTEAGFYAFANIPHGPHDLRVDFEGYLPGFGMAFIPGDGGTIVVNLFLGPSLEDAGSVAGTVLTADGEAAVGAHVRLAGMGDPMHPHGPMLEAIADAEGAFSFEIVPPGLFNISAGLMGEGFAATVIEVLPNQTTNVTLELQDDHHGGGGHHPCDSLVIVELTGTAMVLQPDDEHPMARYFLDVDADGEADYRLGFGPPWYNPECDTCGTRPEDGDEITITGGLLTYGEPPLVVVFEINGLFWRFPCRHGGHGGGGHGFGCDPDSIEAIEVEGTAIVHTMGDPLHPMDRYAIDIDANGEADYALMFGRPDYDPNGPEEPNRPQDGDEITIVGGLMDCDNVPLGVIIVYEINGMLWREPGDTTELGPEITEAGDPVELTPVTYLTASNYPNPFNPVTTISYGLPVSGDVSLRVFDIVGREVATLVNGYQTAGTYSVEWDASNLPSGIYLYRVSVAGQTFTNRMVLMK